MIPVMRFGEDRAMGCVSVIVLVELLLRLQPALELAVSFVTVSVE